MRPSRVVTVLLPLATVIAVFWVAALAPIRQPLDYHHYADQRVIAGIPHFWNVVSNLPFAIIGAAGVWWLTRIRGRRDIFHAAAEGRAYLLFFTGELLTCFGSGYYHTWPTNSTLVWDRLVFSLMLTSFFTVVVTEFASARVGLRMLAPMALLGVASVVHWAWTDDLRPYVIVQFLPVLLMPVLFLSSPGRYANSRTLAVALVLYVVAKICELQDHEIYALTGFWSGHTFKHLVAALASCVPLLALMRPRFRFSS